MLYLDRCSGRCNALDDLSDLLCVPSKTKDFNLKVLNMILEINESKSIVKNISCNWKCRFNVKKCNVTQKWSKSRCEYKEPLKQHICKKDCIWKPSICSCE